LDGWRCEYRERERIFDEDQHSNTDNNNNNNQTQKEKNTEQLVREIHDPLGIYGQKEVAALINVWVKVSEI